MANGNTSREILNEFLEDVLRWKSLIGYAENELLFLNKLLDSNAFKSRTPNLYEKLENLKNGLIAFSQETKKIKKKIMEYETELNGMVECEDIPCDTFYSDNHKQFKKSFEDYFLDFNQYKAHVFNITRGMLQ